MNSNNYIYSTKLMKSGIYQFPCGREHGLFKCAIDLSNDYYYCLLLKMASCSRNNLWK